MADEGNNDADAKSAGPPIDQGVVVADDLAPAFAQLDARLGHAVAAADRLFGDQAGGDPYRGLYVDRGEVARLLASASGTPLFGQPDDTTPTASGSTRLARLASTFALSPFETDVLLLAFAPEYDLRYERLYAYLQDHVARRRPSVDLALNLFCPAPAGRIAARAAFAPDAPLLRHALIHLDPDDGANGTPLLARTLRVDPQIIDLLLGQGALDARLSHCCERITVAPHAMVTSPASAPLASLARHAALGGPPLRAYLEGPEGGGAREIARDIAAALGAPLLLTHYSRLQASSGGSALWSVLCREAWLAHAVLSVEGLDDARAHGADIARLVADGPPVVLLSGTAPWDGVGVSAAGVVPIALDVPPIAVRKALWSNAFAVDGIAPSEADMDDVAARFRLFPGEIVAAATAARTSARWRSAMSDPSRTIAVAPDAGELTRAARAQCRGDIGTLARKVEPRAHWRDLVLPSDAMAQLAELCAQAALRDEMLDAWGFRRRLSRGTAVNALFAGPSGTGKTMAAEVVAGALGLALYVIDLAGVVSKYIGETEKNLDRIFAAAERSHAVLLFDEADALFGKRSEVRDAHDRYANLEISYLLQRMDDYNGLAILASNLQHNLDEAFVRRLAFIVQFPTPDEPSRRRIWDAIWPDETPIAPDVDRAALARQFRITGGTIKNIALASSYLAAGNGQVVTMEHVLHATRREYQKLGKTLSIEGLHALRLTDVAT